MSYEEFIDVSKRMVVEYYNRYVHNFEPDMEGVKIDTNNVRILEDKICGDGSMSVVMDVNIDVWINYYVDYNPESINKISSYVTLS